MATSRSFVVYLHGFKSSPASTKAQQARRYFESFYPDIELVIPALPPQPERAVALIHQLVTDRAGSRLLGFIGSSLGGFYSLYLGHHYGVRSVLINPALRPYDLLQAYLGVNENVHTGERFEVRPEHMDSLRALDVGSGLQQERIFLLSQAGDETLDFREAARQLSSARTWLWPGGSHEFEHFDRVLPAVASFLLAEPA